jgi:hypothetical protein
MGVVFEGMALFGGMWEKREMGKGVGNGRAEGKVWELEGGEVG